MTDQDRALRILSLKIVAEMWPLAKRWFVNRPPVAVRRFGDRSESANSAFRAAAQAFSGEAEEVLARFLPRLPVEMPTKVELLRAFDERPDVLQHPERLTDYDPKLDPVLVLRSMISCHKLPLLCRRDSAFMTIADHYRPLTMQAHA